MRLLYLLPSDVKPHLIRTQTWTAPQQKPNNLAVISPCHIPSTLQPNSIINSICMLYTFTLKMEPLLGCYTLIHLHCIVTQNNIIRVPDRCVFILYTSHKCCIHSYLCYVNQNWLTRKHNEDCSDPQLLTAQHNIPVQICDDLPTTL
jgi:hypothetical protein